MGVVVLLLVLLVACVLQGALPCVEILGGARWPILPAVVVCYSLRRDRSYMVAACAMAGVLVDSISLMPFGVSLLLYLGAGFVMRRVREWVNSESFGLVCAFGGAAAFILTLVSGWWLVRRGLVGLSGGAVFGRALGTGVLGCVVTPVVALVVQWLDGAAGVESGRMDVSRI
jgi:cell shape-determining protein MreD